MSKSEHRLGVSEANLVKRRLKVSLAASEAISTAIHEIDQMYGLDSVSFDEKSGTLILHYDASRLCIDGIEDTLRRHGVNVSDDWWTHFKEGYYRFADENVHDNATREPWSCHKK